ncbi:isopentenyl phosphate kinase family protein [Candidatus Daviesbacteria bacterium]|nr:isopentenyl phosphate kinase family protein [Candidatus Daviesbacteria bacterium]
MKKDLIVIKVGGSVVTDKDKVNPTPRLDVITNLTKQVKKVYSSKKYSLVLVHGAGSFAHPLAKKYNLHQGMKTKEQKLGMALTHQSLYNLNKLVLSALIKQSLPAITLTPHSFITQSGGKLNDFNYQIIKDLLGKDLIPLLYGDVVLDNKWGCSILSGDTIVSYLAKKLKAKKVIFLSDVDGIYDCDPKKNPHAKLIPLINNQNFKKVLAGITSTNKDDVTDEMRGKILSIKNNLAGAKVIIINGFKQISLDLVVDGHQLGTRLEFS